jgi:hypothetical protein
VPRNSQASLGAVNRAHCIALLRAMFRSVNAVNEVSAVNAMNVTAADER